MVLSSFLGDSRSALQLDLYADAVWAGDRVEYKSTSGAIIFLSGPNSKIPLGAECANQIITSFSTPESELVAANLAVGMLGIPFLVVCEKIIATLLKLVFNEDNQSALQVMKTSKNSTMHHLPRAHGISVSDLHGYCSLLGELLVYILSEYQKADIFTKCFKLTPTWQHVSNLIGMPFTGTQGAKAFKVLAPAPKKPSPEQAICCVGLCSGNALNLSNHQRSVVTSVGGVR